MRLYWLIVIVVLAVSVVLMHEAVAQTTVTPLAPLLDASHQLDISCIPHGVLLTDQVINSGNTTAPSVEQYLNSIQATCGENGFTKAEGQRVQFYRLDGCAGMNTGAVNQLMKAQESVIERMKSESHYWVVELGCNPNTLP